MPYLISLGVGFVVGLLYWLVRVQSPAPPLIALAGLLGIVLGEHAMPVIRGQFFPAAQEVKVVQPDATTGNSPTASDGGRVNK